MVTKHHPKPEERDERVVMPLPPEEAIAAILAAGPHPDELDDHDHSRSDDNKD